MSFLPRGMLGMCGAHGEPVIGSLLPRNSPPPHAMWATSQRREEQTEERKIECKGRRRDGGGAAGTCRISEANGQQAGGHLCVWTLRGDG